jgi:myo-inositol catabolism protein IolS
MRYNTIGKTGVRVSEIGFGCWTMGGPKFSPDDGTPCGWADVDEDEILRAIKAGADAGVNHWDNADTYGDGQAERMWARCVAKLGLRRDDLVIATKVGWMKGSADHAYEPFHIRHQCEQSLRNLRVDCIDVYYLHHDMWAPDGEPGNLPDAAETMHKLKDEGKIRVIGQSAYSGAGFARSAEVLRPGVFQSWASMLADEFIRPGSPVQEIMSRDGIGFVAFGPLGKGLLMDKFDPERPPSFDSGDVREGLPEFSVDRLRALKPVMGEIKARFGDTPEALSSAATRFVTAHANVVSAIPGFRNKRQAACNVRGGLDDPMSDADVAWCRERFDVYRASIGS